VAASPSSIAGEFAGRYSVDREIGRGATSVVYLARDLDYGRMVAIKVLRPELLDSGAADRFLREIRVTAQLHHPNIVPVLHSGESDGRLFFVLPYLDGGTLRARLEREKQLPIADAVAIAVTIAGALSNAHEKNLLHRDVKPENILFTGGQACLADFGIARAIVRATGEGTTSTGLVRGTVAYMSPEQASGDHEYDGRSDLYSLACVLYEMLAGIPAFVGPTPQAIAAQRLVHEPRPVRVYRPTVSSELETVLQRALATSPADRYQTVQEFVDALMGVPTAPTREQFAGRVHARRSTLALIAVIAAIGVVTVATPWMRVWDRLAVNWETLDTTRIAVLPFDDARIGDVSAQTLLGESMRRWKGISLVESFAIGDAVRRFGSATTVDDARRIARRVGAGRFVRGHIVETGRETRVVATLIDTRSGRILHEQTVIAAAESAYALSPYYALADSLALRGAHATTIEGTPSSSRSLPAVQSMLKARTALEEWDLVAAESLYARALEFDPESNRAALWTAQIRAWRTPPPEGWRALASQAARDTAGMTDEEKAIAAGLGALAAGEYQRACDLYSALAERQPRSFTAWFGLGQCIDLDRTVIPDPSSPSGWRFRSSYQRAIDAYLKAFDALPSVYRGYQGTAYAGLMRTLYVSGRTRRVGNPVDNPTRTFIAAPVYGGDTIAFVPYALADAASGTSKEDPTAAANAVTHMRMVFHRIALAWSAAFPSSPGAKHGLALSLELRGDPAAIDTLRSALRLATDPRQRLQLLAALAWMQVKFGLPDRLPLLREARHSADSVLRERHPSDRTTLELLSRLSALTGRCSMAADFTRRSAVSRGGAVFVPQTVVGAAQARVANGVMGCPVPDTIPSIDALATAAGLDRLPATARLATEISLFGQETRMAESLNRTVAARLAATGDYLIAARIALAEGRSDDARARLATIQRRRVGKLRGDVAPDGVVPESRVWLSLGDSAAARATLDGALADAQYLPPMSEVELDNLILIASTVRAAAMRADLSRDTREAARWARAVITLWSGADPSLQPTIQKLENVARR
jgi:serine/threonine protein kinase/tetratricopeptide (TPR) repeat protein